MKRVSGRWMWLGVSCSLLALVACNDNSSPQTPPDGGTTSGMDCATATTHVDQVVCASNTFLATLTDDQKAKIAELTKVQTARCTEEKKRHEATHAQILALLTPGQHETLQAAADGSAHCHTDGHSAPAEHAVHA